MKNKEVYIETKCTSNFQVNEIIFPIKERLVINSDIRTSLLSSITDI